MFFIRILDIITSLKKSSIVWQEVFDDNVEVRTVQTASACSNGWGGLSAMPARGPACGPSSQDRQMDGGGAEGLSVHCYRQIQGEESLLSHAPPDDPPGSNRQFQCSDQTELKLIAISLLKGLREI